MTDSDRPSPAGDRLAKVIARAGLCSRRDAEGWIKDGRVSVNGNVIRTPAYNVTDKDKIKVDGNPLVARSGTRVWLYHKPPGLVVTEKDPEGRPTIFDALEQAGLPRVLTIGRLDINTEGLLLLTNDGGLKRVLELPATGWLRRYRVRAFGSISQAQLDALKDGIEVEGVKYGPIEATLEREQGSNVWLLFALREGKNREVKNVLAALGLQVNRLIRISYGPFQLGELPVGEVETVKARVLREQLGRRLTEESGADFESEMPEIAAAEQKRFAVNPRLRASAPDREPPRQRRGGSGFNFVDDGRPADREPPPRHDRPGSNRPARTPRPVKPAAPEGPARRILFDDGREPVEYRPRRDNDRAAADERPPRRGAGDERKASAKRETRVADGDRPARKPARSAAKPFVPRDRADAPRRPRKTGAPREAAGERPARKPYVAREGASDRPTRRFTPRDSAGERPARRPYAPRDGGKDRPRSERTAGRPASRPARGPRPEGANPRGPRPAGDRPRGDRPAGGPRPPRPGGGGGRPPRKPRP